MRAAMRRVVKSAWVKGLLLLLISGQVGASEFIRERIESMMFNASTQIDGVQILTGEILADLYASRAYEPLWKDADHIRQLDDLARLAYENGLDPEDYPLDAVHALLDAGATRSAVDDADLEILATETLIRVGYQLRFGKVNPNGLFSDWNFLRQLAIGEQRNQTIVEIAQADSLVDGVSGWISDAPLYQNMRKALARYRQIQQQGGWQQVAAGDALRAGDVDPRIVALRARLVVEGDLETAESANPSEFDAQLHDAVVRFQTRHGLDADGIVGTQSFAALNVPVEKRIDQIRAALERGRWVMDQVQNARGEFVLVNIASAQLAYMRNGRADFVTRVQVGKPYRQTPVFHGDIKYLVFNPTWTVPPTILRQDVLPKLLADADGYLAEKNMDLLDRDGNKVDHTAIDFTALSASNFPYIVRQRPGPWNALGQVKFIFPNSHFVFLHDTPSQALFERTGRAFSSGCIRVEQPFELAELVMNDAEWDQPAFQAVLDTAKERTVHLKKPLSVFLMYWTAMADPDGSVRFYEDIYGRDAVLLEAMAQPPSIDLSSADAD
jgi:murein L,D-transpeptidase YcbB/YkuD